MVVPEHFSADIGKRLQGRAPVQRLKRTCVEIVDDAGFAGIRNGIELRPERSPTDRCLWGKYCRTPRGSVFGARQQSGVSPHTLRHTFASWLVQDGVPIRDVCELCRHEDIRTTMRYAHLAPHATAARLTAIDVAMAGIGHDVVT